MTPTFWLVISRQPGEVVVRLHGALDVSGSHRLGAILVDLIEGQGNLAVTLDLQNLHSIDPTGLEVLTAASAALAHRDGTLTVTGPPDEVLDTLDTAGLTRALSDTTEPQREVTTAVRLHASRSRHPAGSALVRPKPGKIA